MKIQKQRIHYEDSLPKAVAAATDAMAGRATFLVLNWEDTMKFVRSRQNQDFPDIHQKEFFLWSGENRKLLDRTAARPDKWVICGVECFLTGCLQHSAVYHIPELSVTPLLQLPQEIADELMAQEAEKRLRVGLSGFIGKNITEETMLKIGDAMRDVLDDYVPGHGVSVVPKAGPEEDLMVLEFSYDR